MAAKDLVTKGLRRTIGTGEQTLVWEDPWLPDTNARPPNRPQTYDPNLKVSDLIYPVRKEWDTTKLRSILDPQDVPLVRSLHISRNPTADGYCWNLSTSVKYSVKSGYSLARTKKDSDFTFQNQLPSLNPLKEQIWKIKTGKKLCHFLWQCVSGAVAVNESLSKRHIGNDPSCPRCGEPKETINHMMFTCPPARQCWALSTVPSNPGIFPSQNLFSNISYLLSRSHCGGNVEEAIRIFPWLFWYIWKARNEKLFTGRDLSPMDTTNLALRECNAWFLASQEEELEGNFTKSVTTNPTELPTFTCRIDGSWKHDETTSGVGWILLLQDGSIDLLGLRGVHKEISPLHAELKSLIWALKCLSQHQRYCNHFVTDSQELVKMIDTPDEWPAFASELSEFKSL